MVPWIEIDARPGKVVPHVEGRESTLDFKTFAAGQSATLAPHIAGVVYTFGRGGFRTECALEDWRDMIERAVFAPSASPTLNQRIDQGS